MHESLQLSVYLQPFRHGSFLDLALQSKVTKINFKNPYFGSSGSFKGIDMTEKLVTSACCDRQHAHAYLQPFHKILTNNGKIMTYGGTAL